MANFKKGQTVYMIKNYNSTGTYYYQKLIVGSCGAKQMHLLQMDGKTLADRVYVSSIGKGADQTNGFDIFPAVEGFDPAAKALEMAAAFLVAQAAWIEDMIARNINPGYTAAMKRNLAALHAPTAIDRGQA